MVIPRPSTPADQALRNGRPPEWHSGFAESVLSGNLYYCDSGFPLIQVILSAQA